MENISFNERAIAKSLEGGFLEATNAADYLVKKGLSFRKSHNIIGNIVKYCIENRVKLDEVPLGKLKEYSNQFDKDFYESIKINNCINSKIVDCGTNKKQVLKKINSGKKIIESLDGKLSDLHDRIPVFDKIISTYIQ